MTSLIESFEQMTDAAENALRKAYETALQEVLANYPSPKGAFAVIAMGKFGGRELNYYSDLDLIYLFEKSEDQEFYTKLGQRIIFLLSLPTAGGQRYQVDTQLRPSGNSGTLVSSLTAFEEYHRTLGRTWERQSLLKARVVMAPPLFQERIEIVLNQITYRSVNFQKTAEEIHHLRMRMENEIAREKPGRYNIKTGRGGLVDIEFAVQYLQLCHGQEKPVVRTPNTITAIQLLNKEGFLSVSMATLFEETYLWYRQIETQLRLILERSSNELWEGTEVSKKLENQLGEDLIARYLGTREKIRDGYLKILELRKIPNGI